MPRYAKSRLLAYLLRHGEKEAYDEHGYREVSDLIENHGFTLAQLQDIVKNNDKQRFEFSPDGTKIRARQGHSVDVNVDLQEATPPDVLYHGTASQCIDAIMSEGLRKGSRLHVHLSADLATASNVGKRHGEPVVLAINAKAMAAAGITFYLSRNGVWLVDSVPPPYLSIPERTL